MAKTDIKTAKGVVPMIYAYTTPEIARHDGWTKIGYTEQDVDTRLKQQTQTVDVVYKIEWKGNAIYDDGTGDSFTDHDFHRYLAKNKIERQAGTEWFHINPKPEARAMFNDFRENRGETANSFTELTPYKLRAEQEDAVNRAKQYFSSHENGEFLWNCKPRFGKTLAVYDLAAKIDAEKVLVVTNRPSIANSWLADFCKFVRGDHFSYFVSNTSALKDRSYVVGSDSALLIGASYIEFESLQDLKGSVYFGGRYDKYKKIKDTEWDLLVIDEAHEGVDTYKTDVLFDHIQRKHTLHLSGTPFKALASDKFSSDAIYNWTYANEQEAKKEWAESHKDMTDQSPYETLPSLSLFTYKMSDVIKGIVKEGIVVDGENADYAFDLNEFFSTGADGRFIHEASVSKFIKTLSTSEKYPFSTPELRNELKHTFWIVNRVASAKALARKLKEDEVFKDYEIIVAAGDGKLDDDDENQKAFDKVTEMIKTHDKTITISVTQLTTGVTIPEWTAVLMLSNMQSESLYMQAAFRAQNPCLFHEGNNFYRKERAYVFDFDPARTLDIYEKFANNLCSDTVNGRGSIDKRKENIKKLLNFFPVIGEDSCGRMVELDASKVLSIPRQIRSSEVVKRGFMSNLLFQNIGNIFSATGALKKILEKVNPSNEQKPSKISVSSSTAQELNLDENGNVSRSEAAVENKADELFGRKVYEEIARETAETMQTSVENTNEIEPEAVIQTQKEAVAKAVSEKMKEKIISSYGDSITKRTQASVVRAVESGITLAVEKAYSEQNIQKNTISVEMNTAIQKAETEEEVREIKETAALQAEMLEKDFEESLSTSVATAAKNILHEVTRTVETDKKTQEKQKIEEEVRAHLRGFTRTIPSFMMAYGDETTTLANFDTIIPDDVFTEVSSITLSEFRFLRDGGDYIEDNGEIKHYEGHLFDEVVFNDAVQEFLRKKKELSNYFDSKRKEDIFDYIPPQKTNQIFTPKAVVKEMVDMLESENPGCFDDDTFTFADLYMKSGLYITEIVTRLYNSEKIKTKYPDSRERLTHIFSKQVYGCAPTEIIYRIARSFILGFADDVQIEKDNVRLCDTLEYAKNGNLEQKLEELFPELKKGK